MAKLPEREFRWVNRLLVGTVVIGLIALVTSSTWRMIHTTRLRHAMIIFSDGAASALMLVGAVTVLAAGLWFYRLWEWLPVPERRSRLWSGEITPGVAVGLFLLPWFNAYWAFVTCLTLADAIDRRSPAPTVRSRVQVLAPLAVCCQVLVCAAPVSFVAAWMLIVHLHRRARQVAI